jgi:PAS domain S-box-containing protein
MFMQFSLSAFSIIYFISAIISGGMAYISYQRRAVIGATTLMWIMLALTWWSGFNGIENLNSSLGWHQLWSRLGYFGIVSVPVLWLIFAIQYSWQEKAPSVRKLAWLWIVPAITMIMLWTNNWHGLMWLSIDMVKLQGMSVQSVEHGTYFWVHAIYTYGAVLAGAIILVRRAMQTEDAYRGQAAMMLLAAFVLLLGNGLYVFKLLPFRGLDITPFTFTISSLILAWGLFRFKLLDLIPVASEVILQNMGDGILVTDARERIVFINPSFENLAWLTKGTSVGNPVTEVLYNWPDIFKDRNKRTLTNIEVPIGGRNLFFEVNISPLFNHRVYVGCIYDIRDITERVKAENRQSLLRKGLDKETPDEFAPILITFRAKDSRIIDVNNEFILQTGFSRAEALERTVLQLGLLEVTTRSEVTRQVRHHDQVVDEVILVSTKSGEAQAWKISISKTSLDGTELHLWAARPVKQA